jgi:two-component system, NtrC family, response regulator HydG
MPQGLNRRRILVVDDERNQRLTLSHILTEEGFDVVTAESGERAVRLCGEGRFDVVLLDVRLPGIDGVETARRIRRTQDPLVILMSAYRVEQLELEALADGARAFLRKPIDPATLLDLLRQVPT